MEKTILPMKEDIIMDKEPKDSEGLEHGLWVWYHHTGKLWHRGRYVHGEVKGLHLWYKSDGTLYSNKYYI